MAGSGRFVAGSGRFLAGFGRFVAGFWPTVAGFWPVGSGFGLAMAAFWPAGLAFGSSAWRLSLELSQTPCSFSSGPAARADNGRRSPSLAPLLKRESCRADARRSTQAIASLRSHDMSLMLLASSLSPLPQAFPYLVAVLSCLLIC